MSPYGNIGELPLYLKFDILFKKVLIKCSDLPIEILVNIKALKPRKTGHTSHEESYVSFLVMPNFSFKMWGGGMLRFILQ